MNTRSLTYFAPMESMVQMKGLSSSPSPAITGWQKNGPNLNQTKRKILYHPAPFLDKIHHPPPNKGPPITSQ